MNVDCQQDQRQMPKMPVQMFAFDFAFKQSSVTDITIQLLIKMYYLQQYIYAYLTESRNWFELSHCIVFIFFLSTVFYVSMSQAVNFSAVYSFAMKFDRVFALLLQTLLIYIFALDAAHVFCDISLQLAFTYAIYIYKYTYGWIVQLLLLDDSTCKTQ